MYAVYISGTAWNTAHLSNKQNKTVKSSLRLLLKGNNIWNAAATVTIDATGVGPAYTSQAFNMAGIAGQDKDIKKEWVRTSGVPTVGTPHIVLHASWIPFEPLSVSAIGIDPTELKEGIDFSRNITNHRIDILQTHLYGKTVVVGYFKALSYTITSNLSRTVENLVNEINRFNARLIVSARIENKYGIVIESNSYGDLMDSITIARANAAGQILIDGQDVDGPLPLVGAATNKIHLSVGIPIFEDGKLYIDGIPGSFISNTRAKEFEDSQFEALPIETLTQVAELVEKGILVVSKNGAAGLTPDQVLHVKYENVKVVP